METHPQPSRKTLLGVFSSPGTLNIADFFPEQYQLFTNSDFIYVINDDISIGTNNTDEFGSAGLYGIVSWANIKLPTISYDSNTGILTYEPVYALCQVSISSSFSHKDNGYKATTFYILR